MYGMYPICAMILPSSSIGADKSSIMDILLGVAAFLKKGPLTSVEVSDFLNWQLKGLFPMRDIIERVDNAPSSELTALRLSVHRVRRWTNAFKKYVSSFYVFKAACLLLDHKKNRIWECHRRAIGFESQGDFTALRTRYIHRFKSIRFRKYNSCRGQKDTSVEKILLDE
jgi:hypothetical protein